MRYASLPWLWCAILAYAGQLSGSAAANPNWSQASNPTPHRSGLAPPRYFVDPVNRHVGVGVVRAHMEPNITIAGHYSQSVIGCGTACWSSWLVDRRTGAIIALPSSDSDTELIDNVRGSVNSDVVEVIYGATAGATDRCRARSFRLIGTRFTPLGGYSPIRCP